MALLTLAFGVLKLKDSLCLFQSSLWASSVLKTLVLQNFFQPKFQEPVWGGSYNRHSILKALALLGCVWQFTELFLCGKAHIILERELWLH